MVFYLTEAEKIYIIIFATSLFLLTVVITVCVVSPICLLNKLFMKLCSKVDESSKNKVTKQQIITPESKHFQLKVVPLYGSQATNNNEYQSNLERLWRLIDESSVRLQIRVDDVSDLILREYGCEPTVYVIIALSTVGGIRNRRKSSVIAKAAISFRTLTAKRGLNAVFNETFVTSDLPKSILKEGRLKIKLMDEERYANDYCCGELSLPLKKFLKSEENCDTTETHTFIAPKECKGELTYGICYLPTSRRVTFNVVKANLMGHSPGNNNS
ncbi:synaptotagmin-2-like protein, partial [Leptotrombidium deliense]